MELEVTRLKRRLDELRKAKNTTVIKREREMVEVKAPSFGHKRYFIEQRGEFVESEVNSQLAQFSFIVVQLYFVRESKSQDADLHKNLEGNEHKRDKFLQELKDAHCSEIKELKQKHEAEIQKILNKDSQVNMSSYR